MLNFEFQDTLQAATTSTEGVHPNYLCLPEVPEWGRVVQGLQPWSSHIYGTEYDFQQGYDSTPFSNVNNGGLNLRNHVTLRALSVLSQRDPNSRWWSQLNVAVTRDGDSSTPGI